MRMATRTILVYNFKTKQENISPAIILQELDLKLIGSQLIEVRSI